MEHPNFWYFLDRFLARTYDVAWSSWGGNTCSKAVEDLKYCFNWNQQGQIMQTDFKHPFGKFCVESSPKIIQKNILQSDSLLSFVVPAPNPEATPLEPLFSDGCAIPPDPRKQPCGNPGYVASTRARRSRPSCPPGKWHTSCHQWHMFDLFLLGGDTSIQHKPGKRTS